MRHCHKNEGEKRKELPKLKSVPVLLFFCLDVTITAAVLVFKCVLMPYTSI